MLRNFNCLFFLFLSIYLNAQSISDIHFPTTESERANQCNSFLNIIRNKPKEVYFSVQREGNQLYFVVTDKEWAKQLFTSSGDGIAVDVVSKSRYECTKVVENSQIRGTLLNPVFAKKLLLGLKHRGKEFKVLVGNVPKELDNDELEFNILFLKNKTFCLYHSTYNLESYPWDLLDMGVYLDSLVYKNKEITSSDKFVTKYKSLKFVVPFEKNKSEYLPQDIKPLYDSLQLTDFDIKKINIKAYSSIEGSLERNLELQEKRANSIVKSLQSFQKPTIITQVSTSENWVEFLNDVQKTPYKEFKNLSKKEIKSKVVGKVSDDLELYLKNHRKAVIELALEKKDKYKDMSLQQLKGKFDEFIKSENIEEASVVQNSIFEKLKEENNPDFINGLQVPKQLKFVPILNKNAIFKYFLNVRYAKIAYDELKLLEKLSPNNKKIKYNIVVAKFIIWRYNWEKINVNDFKNQILELKKYGIRASLIDRMLINFHIVKAENDLRNRNYEAKDASVDFIVDTYEKFDLSNYDYLSLAQFLTYYSNLDDATDLLEDEVKKITVDEDLLFYYINLTITKENYISSENYRVILLNAYNMNEKRFCKLFNASNNGGVTFQLLENEYLRKSYCESCTE